MDKRQDQDIKEKAPFRCPAELHLQKQDFTHPASVWPRAQALRSPQHSPISASWWVFGLPLRPPAGWQTHQGTGLAEAQLHTQPGHLLHGALQKVSGGKKEAAGGQATFTQACSIDRGLEELPPGPSLRPARWCPYQPVLQKQRPPPTAWEAWRWRGDTQVGWRPVCEGWTSGHWRLGRGRATHAGEPHLSLTQGAYFARGLGKVASPQERLLGRCFLFWCLISLFASLFPNSFYRFYLCFVDIKNDKTLFHQE